MTPALVVPMLSLDDPRATFSTGRALVAGGLTIGPGCSTLVSRCSMPWLLPARSKGGSPSGRRPVPVPGQVGKLDTVVGANGVDRAGHVRNKRVQEGSGFMDRRLRRELDEGEFRRPIDGNEEIELAFGRLHLGDVDVDVADRAGLELPLRRSVCAPGCTGGRAPLSARERMETLVTRPAPLKSPLSQHHQSNSSKSGNRLCARNRVETKR